MYYKREPCRGREFCADFEEAGEQPTRESFLITFGPLSPLLPAAAAARQILSMIIQSQTGRRADQNKNGKQQHFKNGTHFLLQDKTRSLHT